MDERKYWFWINNIPGIGNIKTRKLLEYYENDPYNVFNTSYDVLMSIDGITDKNALAILDYKQRDKIFRMYENFCNKDIRFVFPIDKEYPLRLRELYDKPLILYYKGSLPQKNRPSAAVVGSRNCSPYGRSVAKEIGRLLGTHGVNVISGLALGIDSEAHKGCVMSGGRTYAVLAGTAEQCYPAQNFNLYMDILNDGGILSEYPPGTKTVPGMFPMRNRIISGLADVVIVVEAGAKSGSLITVSQALEQNRQVMAVPGRLGDPSSIGCNELIADGARIINSYDTILDELGIYVSKENMEDKKIFVLQVKRKCCIVYY